MVSVNPLLSALDNSNDGGTTTTNNTHSNNTNLTSASNATVPHGVSSVLHTVRVEELIILGVIISMWVVAVLSFLRKWSTIRILQPVEPRYRHTPKNLENVRVVKRAQDSVIYKNYSRKMSVTMVARENKRLQRMHTVPIMSALPTLPTIAMETNTTEM